MAAINTQLSTGIPGLDRVLRGIMPGDNIVWRVGQVEDYVPLVQRYDNFARETGRSRVYFRFARHKPLLQPEPGLTVCSLEPQAGFEQFLATIHDTIESAGRGAFYVFDCLSDLLADWYSDQMLGNFFMLTCPYLFDLETVAYFALLRDRHSVHAIDPIVDTTQLFSDVYRHQGELYIRPLKVQQRFSPTMHMIHVWRGEEFLPVSDSVTISEIQAGLPWSGVLSDDYQSDIWNRTFLEAERAARTQAETGQVAEDDNELLRRTLRMVVSRDEQVVRLAEKYFSLADVVAIKKRMIGTGLIGGKAVGMLLARAILKHNNPRWEQLLEIHDSVYVGSDIFYSFLVRNGCWWVRAKQRDPATFLEGAETARQRILRGDFPDFVIRQFSEMLDYFGQSPIIVRSSSLLEDNFGNAFAGKYESVFCVGQAPREKRLEDFLSAVRAIYASSMSEEALSYRARRGLLDRDEQMALLVQRVSGAQYGQHFFPQLAGVGFSFNPYRWSEQIDPDAGVLRLVVGLGTRAVDRADDDYTRLVALNAPDRRPETNFDEVKQYAQRKIDTLDLESNKLMTSRFEDVAAQADGLPLDLVASRDGELARLARQEQYAGVFPWVITFDRLLRETPLVEDMREMLATLAREYDYPVDVEFTANFQDVDRYRINLVQCRPLQVKGGGIIAELPSELSDRDIVLEARGAVIGQSRTDELDYLVYVKPAVYSQLPVGARYSVARLIGQITKALRAAGAGSTLLVGPGRWGTTSPSLGVPVSFAQINGVSMVCEIVAMHGGLVPDVSLGTHFFSELVEMDMLYMALFPDRDGNKIDEPWLLGLPNRLAEMVPGSEEWESCVRVVNLKEPPEDPRVKVSANALRQRVVCYLDRPCAEHGEKRSGGGAIRKADGSRMTPG